MRVRIRWDPLGLSLYLVDTCRIILTLINHANLYLIDTVRIRLTLIDHLSLHPFVSGKFMMAADAHEANLDLVDMCFGG